MIIAGLFTLSSPSNVSNETIFRYFHQLSLRRLVTSRMVLCNPVPVSAELTRTCDRIFHFLFFFLATKVDSTPGFKELVGGNCPGSIEVCCRSPTVEPVAELAPEPKPAVYESVCGVRNSDGLNVRITNFKVRLIESYLVLLGFGSPSWGGVHCA